MQINNCKLNKRVQKKLLEFFVLEVTARSAADILGILPNSAILFYRKIRMVISHHLALAAELGGIPKISAAERAVTSSTKKRSSSFCTFFFNLHCVIFIFQG